MGGDQTKRLAVKDRPLQLGPRHCRALYERPRSAKRGRDRRR